MTTQRTLLISVLSCLLGLAVGATAASKFWKDFYMEFMSTNRAQQIQTDIVTKAAVLNHLRAGQTDSAAKLLEGLLDGDILAAGYLVRDGHTLNKNTITAVEKEQLARKVSGYESPNAAVAAGVKDALQKISPAAKKH